MFRLTFFLLDIVCFGFLVLLLMYLWKRKDIFFRGDFKSFTNKSFVELQEAFSYCSKKCSFDDFDKEKRKKMILKGIGNILIGILIILILLGYCFGFYSFDWKDIFFIWLIYIAFKKIIKGFFYFFKN